LEEVRWDDVVLQERSDERRPFVRDLHARVAAAGGPTVIVDLGAHGAGDYATLGRTLRAPLAPIGAAWGLAVWRHPALDLLADDERHPNRAGSFLIACVSYATLTGRNPVSSGYAAGLDPTVSRFLKRAAWDAYRLR
jgi:hypothetical protein